MQKNILTVLSSFLGVALIIMLGTNIAYRTNVIPALKDEFANQQEIEKAVLLKKEDELKKLKEEVQIARKKQKEAEEKLKEKLAEEERIRLEKEQKIKDAQIAAEQRATAIAAENARIAAEKAAKKAAKKSKAS